MPTEAIKKEEFKMTINLNHGEALFLHDLPFGSTQSIEIKLGRKSFMADIDKNQLSASIDFYQKLNSDRKKYSKYEAMVADTVFVHNDAMLDRHFFEDIKAISEAQRIQRKYNMILDRCY